MIKLDSYCFVKVSVFPPQNEQYFQLFVGDSPSKLIYSESHLKHCLDLVDDIFSKDLSLCPKDHVNVSICDCLCCVYCLCPSERVNGNLCGYEANNRDNG